MGTRERRKGKGKKKKVKESQEELKEGKVRNDTRRDVKTYWRKVKEITRGHEIVREVKRRVIEGNEVRERDTKDEEIWEKGSWTEWKIE